MSGSQQQDLHYVSMVAAVSNFHGAAPPHIIGAARPLNTAHPRTSTSSSIDSSASTASAHVNLHPGATPHRFFDAQQRLPSAANASTRSTNAPLPSATTKRVFTHNPYANVVLCDGSKNASMDTSIESYHSFQATYGDSTTMPTQQPRLHPLPRQQQQQQQRPAPVNHSVVQRQPQQQQRPIAAKNATPYLYPSPIQQQPQQQPQPPPQQPQQPQQQPQQQPSAPVYAPSLDGGASDVTEQFLATVGNIAATACTSRGRHFLISVLRLQHVDKVELIFREIGPRVNTVALDQHGCHVLRTLTEFLTTEQMAELVQHFFPKTIIDMATTTQNTRRALQCMFERHQTPALTPLVATLASDSRRLATTQQGCIALMRVIEHGLPEQKQMLVASVLPVLPALTMDPYGNYVVQCVLDNADAYTTLEIICGAFAGHWVPLSCNKFASNVMEKVVRRMDPRTRAGLVAELVFDSNNLHCLMQDGFGNFVLQAVIDSSADADEFHRVFRVVEEHVYSSPYGHKIEAKLRAKYMGLFGEEAPRSKPAREGKSARV